MDDESGEDRRPHVVIIGGGFGGLAAAKALRRAPARITLVDKHNHHLFQPLLYQVATAALSAPDIAAPIRKVLASQENVSVLMATVRGVDVEKKKVHLRERSLGYDYLIVAAGMTNSYFGNHHWEEHAPGLKSLHEALDIRARMLRAYEAAERATDPEVVRSLLTFVVIGAGPTGVEMAGALAEIAHRTLARDFRSFNPRDARVILVEAGERVLGAFHPETSAAAEEALKKMRVEVRKGVYVTDVNARGVRIGEEFVRASTVVWAAGVKANPLTASLGAPLDRMGRVKVDPELNVPGREEVYVIGDLIHMEQDGALLPGVAQLALQSGERAAKNIENALLGYPRRPFRYWDRGSMSTIGRNQAVAEVGDSRFSGLFAWLIWVFIHIAYLIDFRNRMAVMMEWIWAYISFNKSARVILDAPEEHNPNLSPNRSPSRNRSSLPASMASEEAISDDSEE